MIITQVGNIKGFHSLDSTFFNIKLAFKNSYRCKGVGISATSAKYSSYHHLFCISVSQVLELLQFTSFWKANLYFVSRLHRNKLLQGTLILFFEICRLWYNY